MITLRKGGFIMYNVSFSLIYKVNISDETVFQLLSEIIGVAPTDWFIAQNVGKYRKETFAYIVNNTPEYIQLIPLKGNKKNGLIDKGNIITLNKATDIEKCSIIISDYYKIKLKLKNGTKFLLVVHLIGSTKHQRESVRGLRQEYRKQNLLKQTLWYAFYVVTVILAIIVGCNIGQEIAHSKINAEQLQEQETIKEIEATFEQTKAYINSPEYKDLFSVKVQPFESDAVVTGKTKVVELNSFRFIFDKNAEFHKFDSGDYSYIIGGENHTLGVGFVDTFSLEAEGIETNKTVDKNLKNGTLEKMGYSIKSQYDMNRTKYVIDYFSDDINEFNTYEKVVFNKVVSDMLSDYNDGRKILAVYEKEFDSYYMLVQKVQYDDMADVPVYAYDIDIFFKDDLNTFEAYSITSLNHTEEECFAIINSMELIEE